MVGAAAGVYAWQYSFNQRHEADTNKKIREAGMGERRVIPSREENINKMQESAVSDTVFDILVVGGGATGAGVALDAATRGLSVACVEQEDWASGTSSRSTKLLWAGSRYLVLALVKLFNPKNLVVDPAGTWTDFVGTFKMVLGCHQERRYMLSMNR